MASNALKVILLFLACIAILAPLATARTATALEDEPFRVDYAKKFSFSGCKSFISEASICIRDVFKHPVAPHPSCCEAIVELHECSSLFTKAIPFAEMALMTVVCSKWGVTIP